MLLATLSGVTALVSVQMIEASHATITDAVLRDALKTLAVRRTVPDSEKLASAAVQDSAISRASASCAPRRTAPRS